MESVLKCPSCNSEFNHIIGCSYYPENESRNESVQYEFKLKGMSISGNYSGRVKWRNREGGVKAFCSCELCGKHFDISLYFHKGNIFVDVV